MLFTKQNIVVMNIYYSRILNMLFYYKRFFAELLKMVRGIQWLIAERVLFLLAMVLSFCN